MLLMRCALKRWVYYNALLTSVTQSYRYRVQHLLMPDGDDGPTAFLATRNFKAIMRYNPSTQYAMAVSTLAQEIVDEAAALRRAGGGK